MKLNYFKIPNMIFDDESLSYSEFAVLCYLISIYGKTSERYAYKTVKQDTIAKRCNIQSLKTVRTAINGLMTKGYIARTISIPVNHKKRALTYVLNRSKTESSLHYTTISREVFRVKLDKRTFKLYCFMLSLIDSKCKDMWNSYTDIARTLKIKRSDVIEMIHTLINKRLISKIRYLAPVQRDYRDNLYSLKIKRYIKKRSTKKEKPHCEWNFSTKYCELSYGCSSTYNNNEFSTVCQVFFNKKSEFFIFFNNLRGSPQNYLSLILPSR